MADDWNSLLGAVPQRMSLPADIRELVILRIAVLNRAPCEWQVHEPDARRAGLGDEQLAEVGKGEREFDAGAAGGIADTPAMSPDVRVPPAPLDAQRAGTHDPRLRAIS
ncbi:carboxymuconolactone decarboxylase family protein, partial [Streptomyces sp. NPDC056660]|uniref:carboxymuconolactone decarboxylase family protein n=1 Tax=Streptomyces sp. NPDC056660 TaxID=3345897 RepID=UPI0036BB37D7